MKMFILIMHLIVSVGLVGLILLQSSKGGLTSSLTGGELYRTKRGAERLVFISTIIAAILFFFTSMGNILVR